MPGLIPTFNFASEISNSHQRSSSSQDITLSRTDRDRALVRRMCQSGSDAFTPKVSDAPIASARQERTSRAQQLPGPNVMVFFNPAGKTPHEAAVMAHEPETLFQTAP